MNWIETKVKRPRYYPNCDFVNVIAWCPIYGTYMATYSKIDNTAFGEWKDWNGSHVLPPQYWMKMPDSPIKTNSVE